MSSEEQEQQPEDLFIPQPDEDLTERSGKEEEEEQAVVESKSEESPAPSPPKRKRVREEPKVYTEHEDPQEVVWRGANGGKFKIKEVDGVQKKVYLSSRKKRRTK